MGTPSPSRAPAELPSALVLEILACNSTAVGQCTARQVGREAYLDTVRRANLGRAVPSKQFLEVPAHDPQLPPWMLQQMWRRTHPFFKPKLLDARYGWPGQQAGHNPLELQHQLQAGFV